MSRTIALTLFYLVLIVLSLSCDMCHSSAAKREPRQRKFGKLLRYWFRGAKAQSKQGLLLPSFLLNANHSTVPFNSESTMNTVQIVVNRGYPVASYSVLTEDGYILEVHRIPCGQGKSPFTETLGKPVFLQHGLLGSSTEWVISPTSDSLAFKLADSGYDVWLGNARGNTYSRKHKNLNPSQKAFWDFSWDEMGKYDVPAVLKFILQKTGKEKLIYVGYSMGCSMFFVAMATHPELTSKVEVMMGLAPAGSLAHMSSPVIRTVAPFVKHIEALLAYLGVRAFLPSDSVVRQFQKRFCQSNFKRLDICRNMLFLIVGDGSDNLDLGMLPLIDENTPAGTSVRTAAQFAMNFNSGQTFIPYDFGLLGNLIRYGKLRPPPYDLAKVTVPIYLYYGLNDFLVRPEDVAWLATKLPNVKEVIQIDNKLYNHVNFLWSKNNSGLLYDQLISRLPPPRS